jgi:hypothetical protein
MISASRGVLIRRLSVVYEAAETAASMQNAEFRMQNRRVFFSIQHSAFAGCRRLLQQPANAYGQLN